ncbi:MAG: MarR family transcriptional regulator [Ghiorsea sp.]
MVGMTDDFELERAVGFYVNRAAYLLSEEIARRFKVAGYNISAQDFGILFRLWKDDGLTQVEISSLMMRDKTTITRRLDSLVKKEFIERRNDEKDRRFFRIHLTDKGRAATACLMMVVGDFQNEVLADVSDEEKTITIKTLKKITESIIGSKT